MLQQHVCIAIIIIILLFCLPADRAKLDVDTFISVVSNHVHSTILMSITLPFCTGIHQEVSQEAVYNHEKERLMQKRKPPHNQIDHLSEIYLNLARQRPMTSPWHTSSALNSEPSSVR